MLRSITQPTSRTTPRPRPLWLPGYPCTIRVTHPIRAEALAAGTSAASEAGGAGPGSLLRHDRDLAGIGTDWDRREGGVRGDVDGDHRVAVGDIEGRPVRRNRRIRSSSS